MRIFKGVLLVVLIFSGTVVSGVAESNVVATQPTVQKQAKPIRNQDPDDKYWAYSMDGVTSASKLAAQRSHTVAGKDERNFAIFSAVTVVLIIYFFTQFEFFR